MHNYNERYPDLNDFDGFGEISDEDEELDVKIDDFSGIFDDDIDR